MNKKVYMLTDGSDEIFKVRLMSQDEYEDEQRKANEATNGIYGWVEVALVPPAQTLELVALKAMLKYIEFDAATKCCPVCGGPTYHDSACMLAAFLYPEKAKSYEYHIHSTHIHDILFDVENNKRFESLKDELYRVPGYVVSNEDQS